MMIIPKLNMASTPGYPYCLEKPTIGQWLGWDGFQARAENLERLWFDCNLVIENKYEHIMKSFIKMEPHKLSKAKLRRWRIIIGFSLPVQVVWKMLFDYTNDLMVKKAYETPLQHGLVLFEGGWKQYLRQWKSQGYNSGTDASAWDWTVSGWLVDAVLELRTRLVRGNEETMRTWTRIAQQLYASAFSRARILLPSGELLQQEFDGLQKSGSPNTISDNSMMRYIASIIVTLRLEWPIRAGVFCGDDALESLPDDVDSVNALINNYRDLGIIIKSVERGLEFVGHTFTDKGPIPLYLGKHLWKLKYTKEEDLATFLDAMCRLYCHCEHFALWEFLARRLGVQVYSRSYYLDWYDFEIEPQYRGLL